MYVSKKKNLKSILDAYGTPRLAWEAPMFGLGASQIWNKININLYYYYNKNYVKPEKIQFSEKSKTIILVENLKFFLDLG